MDTYLVTFGRSPELSRAEFDEFCSFNHFSFQLKPLNLHQILVQGQLPVDLFQQVLAGVVKIAEVIGTFCSNSGPLSVFPTTPQNTPKIALSSFSYSQASLRSLIIPIKSAHTSIKHIRLLRSPLESSGIRSKYIEYQLASHHHQNYLCRVVSVQDISRWGLKDYHKPFRHPRSGMLPPKIARIMVNLALPQSSLTGMTVYDPMCGSGTILIEALDRGAQVLGSDLSPRAVSAGLANCRWFIQHQNLTAKAHIWQADISSLKPDSPASQADAIVFEGYLGPPTIQPGKVDNLLKGLTKLYTGAFKRLSLLQSASQRLVCALPQYQLGSSVKNLAPLIDTCEKYGYTLLRGPLIYGRPQAQVKRAIYVLVKN